MDRNDKTFNPAGSATFVLGRALSPLVCYSLLTNPAIHAPILSFLHLTPPSRLQLALPPSSIYALPPTSLLVLSTVVISALRHIYWVARAPFTISVGPAAGVVAFNQSLEVANILAFLARLASVGDNAEISTTQIVGAALFGIGMLIEVGSEETRRAFKSNPANKGRVDSTAFFAFIRHPPYLGYLLWRGGAALISGYVPLAIGVVAANLVSFAFVGIPDLTSHMRARYGAEWTEYEDRVPYKLVPGIW